MQSIWGHNLQAWTTTISCLSRGEYESVSFTWPFPDPQMGAAQGRVPELIRSTILESRIYRKGNKNLCSCWCIVKGWRTPLWLAFSSALNRTWLSGKAPSRWNHWSTSSCGSASRFLTGSTSDPIGWSHPLDNCGASKREKIQRLKSRYPPPSA